MTVDMLAATFFWPEGTLLHVREDIAHDGRSEELQSTDHTFDPLIEPQGETFWATVLRQIGWPLQKPVTHS